MGLNCEEFDCGFHDLEARRMELDMSMHKDRKEGGKLEIPRFERVH
jgi:hypothetical protein